LSSLLRKEDSLKRGVPALTKGAYFPMFVAGIAGKEYG
jgi:hypothetical protein